MEKAEDQKEHGLGHCQTKDQTTVIAFVLKLA
jgi:hypothetical protein